MQRSIKKFKSLTEPAAINGAILIKYLSGIGTSLRFLSPLASFLFIILNLNRLLKSKSAIITLAFFAPALILTPGMDIFRIITSVAVMWIFFSYFSEPVPSFYPFVTIFVLAYAVAMFAGIFDPDNYFVMGNGDMRYKFNLETHNALCIVALLSFIYLTDALNNLSNTGTYKILKIASFIGLILLSFTFLAIKSRLYIGLSLTALVFVAVLTWKKNKFPAILCAVYIVLFFGFNWVNEKADIQEASAGMERLISTNATGREKLTGAFWQLIKEKGWQNFIYQNNVAAYYEKKRTIPDIDMAASTLTENAYFITILNTGILGLTVLLVICAVFLLRFLKRKELFSLIYMLLIMGVWYFEETIMYPLSMIAQFFALATVNRLERNANESSTGD